MTQDAIHWKMVAAYLASCHAATLEGLSKSCSKQERQRHVDICLKAAAYLGGNYSIKMFSQTPSEMIEASIERCERAAKNHGAVVFQPKREPKPYLSTKAAQLMGLTPPESCEP